MTLTPKDVPDEIHFVDEDDNPIPELGTFRFDPLQKSLVLTMARKWHMSVPATLQRMFVTAIREYVSRAKVDGSTVRPGLRPDRIGETNDGA